MMVKKVLILYAIGLVSLGVNAQNTYYGGYSYTSKNSSTGGCYITTGSSNDNNIGNDSVGYYHNIILSDLSQILPKNKVTIDTVFNKVAIVTEKYYKEPAKNILNGLKARSNFFDSILYIKGTELEKCESLHEIFAVWKKQNPGNDKELDVLEEFFNGIVNIDADENDGTFMNKALDIVDKSSLDETTKENLRNAFIVGNASYQLWNAN